jgi:hypothetical protein
LSRAIFDSGHVTKVAVCAITLRQRDRVKLLHKNRRQSTEQSVSLWPGWYLRLVSRVDDDGSEGYEETLTQLRLIAGKRTQLADGVPLLGLSIATGPSGSEGACEELALRTESLGFLRVDAVRNCHRDRLF